MTVGKLELFLNSLPINLMDLNLSENLLDLQAIKILVKYLDSNNS